MMVCKRIIKWLLLGLTGVALLCPPANAARLWADQPESPNLRKVATLPDFVDLAAKLSPAVVNISTEQKETSTESPSPEGEADPFDRFGQPFEHYGLAHPHSLGSGFVINKEGYILTNDHVVEDAKQIVVTLKDGREFKARVIGRDSKSDIALIKIEPHHDLPVAPLGNSDDVKVGEWVMAIGNPFGFDHSVTAGIVSAKGRYIPGNYDEFLQTDASINPGNSGGPLIDLSGAVVGVNSAIYTRTGMNMGIGFAIPVNLVKAELPELRTHGKIERGWLGVYIQPVTAEIAQAAGLSEPGGAVIADVLENGPAKVAGLRHGDIILEYDHHPLNESQQLPLLVGSTRVGEHATLKILRGKATKELTITITPSHEEQLALASARKGNASLGLSVQDLSPGLAHDLKVPASNGVIVRAVEPGSSADSAGLREHDIIVEVNRRTVKDVASYERALEAGAGSNVVLLLVKRDNGTLYIPLKRRG
jgi:serine protease Do